MNLMLSQFGTSISGAFRRLSGTSLALLAAVVVFTLGVPVDAFAQAPEFVTSATAGIDEAKDNALSVGGAVIAAVALLIAVGWVLSMLKKR